MELWNQAFGLRLLVCTLAMPFLMQILTDKYLHVIGDTTDSVYALGDCADIKDNSLPCIAQVGKIFFLV